MIIEWNNFTEIDLIHLKESFFGEICKNTKYFYFYDVEKAITIAYRVNYNKNILEYGVSFYHKTDRRQFDRIIGRKIAWLRLNRDRPSVINIYDFKIPYRELIAKDLLLKEIKPSWVKSFIRRIFPSNI